MNNNIIEIITIIIQKLIKGEDEFLLEEDKITEELYEMGYSSQEIDRAFTFIYTNSEVVEEDEFFTDLNYDTGHFYRRIFTDAEKIYFEKDIKGILYKINDLKILTDDEYEMLINRMMQTAFLDKLDCFSIWSIINDLVSNDKLEIIIDEIDEFNEFWMDSYKNVN